MNNVEIVPGGMSADPSDTPESRVYDIIVNGKKEGQLVPQQGAYVVDSSAAHPRQHGLTLQEAQAWATEFWQKGIPQVSFSSLQSVELDGKRVGTIMRYSAGNFTLMLQSAGGKRKSFHRQSREDCRAAAVKFYRSCHNRPDYVPSQD